LAAIIVAIMLIPQSLAYALVAGLPAEAGLYASIVALIFYGLFGTSTSLSVGPVAAISLMTAAVLSKVAVSGSSESIAAAMTLAFLCGLFLVLLGIFRLGFLANSLSQPVIAAFISASAIIIAAGQLQYILGISTTGNNLLDILLDMSSEISNINFYTLTIGFVGMVTWSSFSLQPS